MPQNLRATNKVRKFNIGVSYRAGDNGGKLIDARNVCSVQDRLDTRFGTSRRNAVALPGPVQSLSTFVKTDGTVYELAKVGMELYLVAATGAHTLLKGQLNEEVKHRGITVNNRHIIAIGDDSGTGLYSFNGDICTVLGQPKPAAIPTGVASATGTLAAATYRVAYTFYASSIGFESNYIESADIVVGANEKITVANIQTSATNDLVDKVYVYLKNATANGAYLFVGELSLGTAGIVISGPSLSSQTPPTKNAPPLDGGGLYLTQFGNQTVYAGNDTYRNEVYFSEPDLPDAYDSTGDQLVLAIGEDGPITGIATGIFSDSHLSPYLVIFKRKSTHIYSDLSGDGGSLVCINNKVGCVSHDTIVLKDGVIYFMSEEGWRAINNGRLVTNKNGEAITLGNGDIDDIFRSPGYVYEVNRAEVESAFSVYYPALGQYMTWVPEGSNDALSKTYVYEFDTGAFKPWEFAVPGTCACVSKDANGSDIVLIGTGNGYVLKHSIYEARTDVDLDNAPKAINAFAIFPWLPDDPDFDATYNYRELIVKSIVAGTLTLKTFLNYSLGNIETGDMEFPEPVGGVVFDESIFDEAIFGDGRETVTSRYDINRVGETIAFGFYQNSVGANMGLVSLQLDANKNGNRNIPSEEVADDIFGSEEESLYPSNSESQLRGDLEAAIARISLLEGMIDTGDGSNDSWRFRVVDTELVMQVRLAGVWTNRWFLTPIPGSL